MVCNFVLLSYRPIIRLHTDCSSNIVSARFQDSLLSRFDLLFILLDSVDEESDRKISDHVVRVHRYRDPREADGAVTNIYSGADDLTTLRQEKDADGDKDVPMWDDNDALFGGNNRRSDRLLHIGFVRKYIEIAKCLKPGTINGQFCVLPNV